jgi:hypothetical protein
MTPTHVVRVFIENPDSQPHMSEVLMSLPLSLERSSSVAGAVAAIQGTRSWPASATRALAAGAIGIVINDPDPVPDSEIEPLRAMRQPVLLDQPYVSDPATELVRARWGELGTRTLLVESTLQAPVRSDPSSVLLHHAALVRAVVGSITSPTLLTISRYGYTAKAVLPPGAAVILTGTLTDAGLPRAEIHLLAAPHRLSAVIYPSSTARPATVSMVDAEGEVVLPSLYENGHRATWRRMLSCLADATVDDDLDDFVAHLATVGQLFVESGA